MQWGFRTVGAWATLQGTARLGYLYLRRPKRSEVHLRSGPVLEFGYPSQVPLALLMFGDLIDPEYAFLRRISRPDWIVADVGAAIGQFTLFAATLPCAIVHSFEPSVANVVALRKNVARNGVGDRASIHKLAFSSAEGESNFETKASTWTSGLSRTGSEIVSVRTIADEFRRLGLSHVSVLKINVAGFEPSVLEGAESFLSKGAADILILLLGLASLPWYAKLAAYGYRFFYFHPGENALYEVTSFDESSILEHRPWPARHIIAVYQAAMDACIGTTISLRKL